MFESNIHFFFLCTVFKFKANKAAQNMGEKLLLKENVHSFCTVKFFFCSHEIEKEKFYTGQLYNLHKHRLLQRNRTAEGNWPIKICLLSFDLFESLKPIMLALKPSAG